jgi:TonB family protein
MEAMPMKFPTMIESIGSAPAPNSPGRQRRPDRGPGAGGRRSLACILLLATLSVVTILLFDPGRHKVVGDERNIEKYAVKRVQPVYPPLAQKQRIEGIVVVQVTVASTGKVTNAEFLRGNNIFKAVSVEAAKRWEFKVSSGDSLEGTIRFAFKLEG